MYCAVTSRVRPFWNRLLELRFDALYVAQWWHETGRGRKGYILYSGAIAWLRERVKNIPIDTNVGQGERLLGDKEVLEHVENARLRRWKQEILCVFHISFHLVNICGLIMATKTVTQQLGMRASLSDHVGLSNVRLSLT